MSKLKRLSGKDLIRVFESFGFSIQSQRGSHVKLRRIGTDGEKQVLTIPSHAELDKGTLKAILRQASRFIPISELRRYFYTD
jgi:predicted RNA binding protein YcfA (HicA-like mRNA interferase family)